MTISFSYYETLVFIHRHLVEIISLLSLGVIILTITLVVNACRKRKANISARKKQGYKVFSPQEWDIFVKNASKYAAESLVEAYDISPKGDDFKKKLCGTWCNPTDTRRYYISDRGGFFVLAIEERITALKHLTTYVLRNSLSPVDKNIFYAEGDTWLVFGYDPDEDIIFNPAMNEELERYEEYIRRHKDDAVPITVDKAPLPSDIMETRTKLNIDNNIVEVE